MTQQAMDLLQKALSLSEQEWADLASSLTDSLDTVTDEGVDEAWNQELADRIGQLDSGKARTIPWEDLRARISYDVRQAHQR